MALTQLTKVDGGGISTTSDYRVGIITASKFVGPFDGTSGNFSGVVTATNGVFSGNISAVDGTFSGNVSIAGTLTYEDVTNIDSVGLVTARDGLFIPDDKELKVGNTASSPDLKIYHNSSNNNSYITESGSGSFHIQGSNLYLTDDDGTNMLYAANNAGVRLYWGGGERLLTSSAGISIPKDLDVDGHTNLDNVSVAGVTTMSGNLTITNTAPKLFLTDSDSNSDYSLWNSNGNFRIYDETNAQQRMVLASDGTFDFNSPVDLNFGVDVSGNANISGDIDVDGHTNLDNVSIAGVTTTTDQLFISAPYSNAASITTQNMPLVVNAYAGSTTGITTVLFQSLYARRPEFVFSSSHNGNWANSVGQTQHWRMLWKAPTEVDTTDEVVELKPYTNGGGDISYFSIKVTDNSTGLKNSARFSSQEVNLYANSTACLFVNQTGIGITDSIYHIGDTDTKIRFPAADTFSVETAGTERLRIHADGEVAIAAAANGQTVLSCLGAYASSSTVDIQTWARSDAAVKAAMKYSHGTNSMNFGTTTNHPLIFQVNNTERIRIDSDGNILLKDAAGQGNSLVHYIRANDSSGNSQYQLGMVSSGNEDLYLIQSRNANLRFQTNATTRWKIDGDGHLLPETAGAVNIGSASAEIGDVFLATDKALKIGNSQIADLFVDSSNVLYLRNNTGQMVIRAPGDIYISDYAGNHRAGFRNDNAVDLYFDIENYSTPKLSTSATGITVTGEVAASQDYPNFRPKIDLNFVANSRMDPRISYSRTGPASFLNENGKIELVGPDAPRIDHDPSTRECKGLLIEESRTNLFPYGTTPGDLWSSSKTGTFEENTTETTAPDGTFTATKWTFTNTDPYLYHAQTLSANTSYTVTMYVKAGTNMAGDYVQIRIGAAPYSPNGDDITIPTDGTWKRISYTKTVGGSAENSANVGFEPQVKPSGNPASGDVIYIWGAQLEEGSFATSFIPTNGSTITRGTEYAYIEGQDFDDTYNDAEGTFLLQATTETLESNNHGTWGVERASNPSGHSFNLGYRVGGGGSGYTGAWYNANGSTSAFFNMNSGVTAGTPFKIAFSYKVNDMDGTTNGGTVQGDTNAAIDPDFDRFTLGNYHYGAMRNGYIQRAVYYTSKLTNNQLKTLTS